MNKSLMFRINSFEFVSPDKWRFLNNAEVGQAAQRASEFVERQFYIDNLEKRIEEYLRQWILVQLVEVYGYPENWLWVTNASKRNANVVIKDGANRSLALIAARNFGDSDLEFEQAGHALQSDLEEIETVSFALVTDGRRIAFLCKDFDDQIGDYKTISDFPSFDELKNYLDTKQLPDLPATTQKFQKLPAAKHPVKLASSTSDDQSARKKQFSLALPKPELNFLNELNGRTIAAVLGVVLLILIGAWYITKSEPLVSGQTPEKTVTAQPEKNDKFNLRSNVPNVSQGRPIAISNGSHSQTEESPRQNDLPRLTDSEGALKLNREEISVMQSRPVQITPSAQNTQSNNRLPVAPTAEIPSGNRKIVSQP